MRAQVFKRNGYTCQMSDIGVGKADEETGRKARLRIGHVLDESDGSNTDLLNLKVPCSRSNQGAKNLTQELPGCSWLLSRLQFAPDAHGARLRGGSFPPANQHRINCTGEHCSSLRRRGSWQSGSGSAVITRRDISAPAKDRLKEYR